MVWPTTRFDSYWIVHCVPDVKGRVEWYQASLPEIIPKICMVTFTIITDSKLITTK